MSTTMPWGERVPDSRDKLTAARAAADQQLALATHALDGQVTHARSLLRLEPETDAWAVLATEIATSLDLDTQYQKFAGEILAAAALRLAKKEETDGPA